MNLQGSKLNVRGVGETSQNMIERNFLNHNDVLHLRLQPCTGDSSAVILRLFQCFLSVRPWSIFLGFCMSGSLFRETQFFALISSASVSYALSGSFSGYRRQIVGGIPLSFFIPFPMILGIAGVTLIGCSPCLAREIGPFEA